MKLDLSEITLSPGMQSDQQVDEVCPQDLGLACVAPVTGRIRLTNTGALLLVKGEISTTVRLECSRCIVDFELPVKTVIEEQFRLERTGDVILALPIDEEDVSAHLIQHNLLDMQELVRQHLTLMLPIQPLCRPDCQGLCPTCGENLNMRKCLCPPAEPQSPFAALAQLLEEENRDS